MSTEPAITSRRLTARAAEVGGLMLRRALPSRGRRLIGAWCFLDHAGPADISQTAGMRMRAHAHAGLQTFTWMIEGEILHRDSLGHEQLIRPGQVNLMTAGRGIVHSEESLPEHPPRLQAAQLWIALPEAQRHCEPAFEHYPNLPVLERDGFRMTLLVGEAMGQRSPVRVHTPLVGMDLVTSTSASLDLPLHTDFEYGVLVLEGSANVAGETLEPGTLLDLGRGCDTLSIMSTGAARLLLIGGEPFTEDVLLWWNFVARTPAEIADYTARWNAGEYFGEVKGYVGDRLLAPALPDNVRIKK